MSTSINPNSVVVAVDGSADANRAVHWAAEQAFLERRPLVVVAATGAPLAPAVTWSGMGAAYAPSAEDLIASAQAGVDEAIELVRHLRPGLDVTGRAVLGDARQVLLDVSRQAHALVLGSRGRGPFRSKLLGSVSAAVSRESSCPVFVCRPLDDATPPSAGILVGGDATAESLPVIESAFQQASLLDLPLTVVHCVWDRAVDEAGLEEHRLGLAESVAGMCTKFPEVNVDLRVERGLAEELLAADTGRWNLVVVGRHPVDTLLRMVTGSVALAVIEHARTTVLVVPQSDPADES